MAAVLHQIQATVAQYIFRKSLAERGVKEYGQEVLQKLYMQSRNFMNLVKKLFLGLFISSLVAPGFYAYSPEDVVSNPPTGSEGSGESSSESDIIGGPIPIY